MHDKIHNVTEMYRNANDTRNIQNGFLNKHLVTPSTYMHKKTTIFNCFNIVMHDRKVKW